VFVGVLGLTLFLGSCGKDASSSSGGATKGPSVKQDSTKESLIALLKKVRALQAADKNEEAGAMTRLLLPSTKERLGKALRPGVPEEKLKSMLAMHGKFAAAPNGRLAGLLRSKPDQSEIQAHCATTEEIAANKPGTIVFKEFPGGAVGLAKEVLKPGLTFCEVEYLKPGEERGMKYHMFFWDGASWTMLGPMWRAMR
jgi:hypothetical protein